MKAMHLNVPCSSRAAAMQIVKLKAVGLLAVQWLTTLDASDGHHCSHTLKNHGLYALTYFLLQFPGQASQLRL